MSDKERLIQIFEHAVNKAWGEGFDYIDLSPSDGKKILELLKEREPKVIDISEIYTAKKLDVWIENKSENTVHPLMLIETEMTNKSQTAFFYPMLVRPIKAYGKTWRCWSARPTDEQRKAVKWDEPPKEDAT